MKFPRAKPREGFKRHLRALSSQGEALLTEFCFAKLAGICFLCVKFAFPELREGFKRHLMPLPELREHFKRHLKPLPKLRGHFKRHLMPLSSQGEALLTEFCFAKLAGICFLCVKFAFPELREGFKRHLRALPKLREHFKCDFWVLFEYGKRINGGFGMLNRLFGAFKPQRFRAAKRGNAILPYGGGYSRLRF